MAVAQRACNVAVDYLSNHRSLVPRLAGWLYLQWLDEWGFSRQQAEDELRGRLNRARVPMALVALAAGEPVGIASLIELERPNSKALVCCLAGVYVLPAWRRRGVGRLLCQRAVLEAERLALPAIGLFTRGFEPFYEEMGWRKVMDAVPPSSGEQARVSFMKLHVGMLRSKSTPLADRPASAICRSGPWSAP